ncbi:efflux RND transporter periplasmic adaptor subunit [soil metagenome]
MNEHSRTRRFPWIGSLVVLIGAAGGLGLLFSSVGRSNVSAVALEDLQSSPVRRADLSMSLRTGGRIDSSQMTIIECQLDRIRDRIASGSRISTSGYASILSLIPDGSMVKEGDLLCELDASEYEELVRQQQIAVDIARSDRQQARLDLEAAEVSLIEYRDGIRLQKYQQFEGEISLAEADYQRQKDRMDWADRMLPLGYIAASRYEQEKLSLLRYQIDLQRVRDTFESYKKYTEPKTVQVLETAVDRFKSTLVYYENRLERGEETLERYKEQVANCTIHAPHDGMVIYADANDDDSRILVGTLARRGMKLFYLPDLGQMEVQALVNQSFIRQVQIGQKARVRVEAFQGRSFEGEVIKVENLPNQDRRSRYQPDVKEYLARIELTGPTDGLLPGMNAEIELSTGEQLDSLVIPAEALTVEKGRHFCYVVQPDGLQRREVTIGGGTVELLEVLEGLEEGDQVILAPYRYDPVDLPVITTTEPSVRVADQSAQAPRL